MTRQNCAYSYPDLINRTFFKPELLKWKWSRRIVKKNKKRLKQFAVILLSKSEQNVNAWISVQIREADKKIGFTIRPAF